MLLKDFIKNLRACNTPDEEADFISRERAEIQHSLHNGDQRFDARYIDRLLYFQILGYDTSFAFMTCIKVLPSPKFNQKRMGYLGLIQLRNPQRESLMLATNTIKHDLHSSNPFVVSQALNALTNAGTGQMCTVLVKEIECLLKHQSTTVLKRALHCAIRLVREGDDYEEDDRFYKDICILLSPDKNASIILGCFKLIKCILQKYPSLGEKYVTLLPKILAILNMATSRHKNNFVESELNPEIFEMCAALDLIPVLFPFCTTEKTEIFAALKEVINTTNRYCDGKKAVLYQVILTILAVDSPEDIQEIAIANLVRFLRVVERDLRFIGLNTLLKSIKSNPMLAMKHKSVVAQCLDDTSNAVVTKAISVISALTEEHTVEETVKEFLNRCENANNELVDVYTESLCEILQRYRKPSQWLLDNAIRTFNINSKKIKESTIFWVCNCIAIDTDCQNVAVLTALKALEKNSSSESNCICCLWILGEFADKLPEHIEGSKILDVFETVSNNWNVMNYSPKLTRYLLTAITKFYARFAEGKDICIKIINKYKYIRDLDLSQRISECIQLFSEEWDSNIVDLMDRVYVSESILENLKVKADIINKSKPRNEEVTNLLDIDSPPTIPSEVNLRTNISIQNDTKSKETDLLNFSELFDDKTDEPKNQVEVSEKMNSFNLDDILGGTNQNDISETTNTNANIDVPVINEKKQTPDNSLLDLFSFDIPETNPISNKTSTDPFDLDILNKPNEDSFETSTINNESHVIKDNVKASEHSLLDFSDLF